ncbi:MAG: TIGR03089 family protein [Mycobacteriales bacterium]
MAATDHLLTDALRRDPAGPALTYYDDATGERTELSATTLANWVAKTGNLLQDEVGLSAGESVAVRLPAHWQTAAVLLASWSVGGIVTTDAAAADVAFCAATDLDAATRPSGQVIALGFAPLGRPMPQPPAGALDYAAVVPAQPDAFSAYQPVGDDAPAVTDREDTRTGGQLVTGARERAGVFGLRAGDRVLSTVAWTGWPAWVDGLLAPLAAGASIVLCAHADPAGLAHRVEAEAVSSTLGVTVDGVRRLDRSRD